MPIAANQSLPQHEPKQIARPSTQRQAHTKFMPSKGNKIGEQTVDTNHPDEGATAARASTRLLIRVRAGLVCEPSDVDDPK